MRAAVWMLVRVDYEKYGTRENAQRASFRRAMSINCLMSRISLGYIRLVMSDWRRVEHLGGTYHGGASFEGDIITMSTTSTVADRAV